MHYCCIDFFFFKQKTAYEMRISDWSSDVCSSDLLWPGDHVGADHLWAVAVFGVLGAMMLGFLGLMTSVWAEKFDHAAAVTNFVVTPLALLSGTRSEERRVGKECVSTCRSRWSPYH